MNSLGKSCLGTLVVWGASAYALYEWFHGRFEPPGDLYGAIGGGFLIGFAFSSIQGCFVCASQRRLISASKTGARPEDGKIYAAIGTIKAIREPLITPIDKKEAVIFGYKVVLARKTYSSKSGSSTDRTLTLMGGFAMTPCSVRTPLSDIKIFGFPVPAEFPEIEKPAAEKISVIAQYASNAEFKGKGSPNLSNIFSQLKDVFNEDDGSLREEWKVEGLESHLELNAHEIEYAEQVVPNNSQVCVIGRYSAPRGGMVSDISLGGIQIYPGDASAAQKALKTKIITGIVCGVLGLLIGTLGVEKILGLREASSEILSLHRERLLNAIGENNLEVAKRELAISPNVLPLESEIARVIRDAPDGKRVSKAMVVILKERGMSLDKPVDDGRTLLLNATYRENLELVQTLLDLGANPNVPQVGYGNTAIEIAFDSGNRELFQILQKAGGEGVFVTSKTGQPITSSNSDEVRIVETFLQAFVKNDLNTVQNLLDSWPEDYFSSFQRGLYDGTRSDRITFLRGYSNDKAATLIISAQMPSGSETWLYTLVKRDGKWKIRRASWDDKRRWPTQ